MARFESLHEEAVRTPLLYLSTFMSLSCWEFSDIGVNWSHVESIWVHAECHACCPQSSIWTFVRLFFVCSVQLQESFRGIILTGG